MERSCFVSTPGFSAFIGPLRGGSPGALQDLIEASGRPAASHFQQMERPESHFSAHS